MKSVLLASVCALALGACVEGTSGELQAQLDAANAKSADLEAQVASLVLDRGTGAPTGTGGPVNAKPGECYARITQPAQFETVNEKVLDRGATAKLKVIPATYKKVQEQVLVKEASERIEVIPATYKKVTERIVVTPAKTQLVTIPATYKTVTERVKVRDAYTAWKPGGSVIAVGANALGGTILQNRRSSTGEVLCLVEIPAEYKTVKNRVEVTPARTEEKVTPAVYKTVSKRVIATPATTRKIEIPAVYGSVTKTVEATPSVVQRTEIPATYKNVARTVEVAPARSVWTSVLCDVNTTPDVVRRLQTALKSQGHYNGKIDGDVGPATRRAIASYQNAQGVESDILTIESARTLGII